MTKIEKLVLNPKSSLSQNARDELKKFVVTIDKRLENYFDNQLKNPFAVNKGQQLLTTQIWNNIKTANLNPAKRLRSSFVFHGYKLLGGEDIESILDASMSVELIHTALLMHDDFMDLDEIRRGSPTTHEYFKNYHKNNYKHGDSTHYGHSMAVVVGDIGLLTGHKILNDSNFDSDIKIKAMSRLLDGIVNTGFGQAYDVTLESIGKAKESEIISLHHAKTSIYTYENPLHIGALLAGASNDDFSLISEYAIPGGIAFQLQDDILGIYGDSEKTGKPDFSDIAQGKVTLLYVKAREYANEEQSKLLAKYYGKRDINREEAEIVREIINKTGSLSYSKNVSFNYAQKALDVIPKMREKGWNKDSIDFLQGIAQYMIERDV